MCVTRWEPMLASLKVDELGDSSVFRKHIPIRISRSVCVYVDVRASVLLGECIRSKQSLPHLQETISSLPGLL